MSNENRNLNEDIGVGAGGADVGSNPTPRTKTSTPILRELLRLHSVKNRQRNKRDTTRNDRCERKNCPFPDDLAVSINRLLSSTRLRYYLRAGSQLKTICQVRDLRILHFC